MADVKQELTKNQTGGFVLPTEHTHVDGKDGTCYRSHSSDHQSEHFGSGHFGNIGLYDERASVCPTKTLAAAATLCPR